MPSTPHLIKEKAGAVRHLLFELFSGFSLLIVGTQGNASLAHLADLLGQRFLGAAQQVLGEFLSTATHITGTLLGLGVDLISTLLSLYNDLLVRETLVATRRCG